MLLTSDGIRSKKIEKAFCGLIPKDRSKERVIILHTVRRIEHYFYIAYFRSFFLKNGFKNKNITTINICHDNVKKITNSDIIFVCGGNTFYILDRIKKTGYDKIITNHIKKNKLYIGLSAGSIVIHKTIEIAGWGSEGDKNEIGLKNLKGLNITNTAIFPHYKDKLKKEVEEFRKKVKYKVVALKDGQALLIKGKIEKIIR